MQEPGEQRPSSAGGRPGRDPARATDRGWAGWKGRGTRAGRAGAERSRSASLLLATIALLLTGVTWAVLRGVLELGVTALAAVALGGWTIGLLLRPVRGALILAALMGGAAWLLGLLLSWLLAMAFLPGSTRTLPERLASTPFLEWLAPQVGLLELGGLALGVGAALYAARPRA